MDKTILSFDVGIKNLAYCIIEFKNEDFTIKDWNIINLVDDRIKCCYEKNNKKCESIAKHVFNIKELDNNEIDNKELYYCKTHLKKAEYKIVGIVTKSGAPIIKAIANSSIDKIKTIRILAKIPDFNEGR